MTDINRDNRTARAGDNHFIKATLIGAEEDVFPAWAVLSLDPAPVAGAAFQVKSFVAPFDPGCPAIALLAEDEDIAFAVGETSRPVSICVKGFVHGDMIDFSASGQDSVDKVLDEVNFPGQTIRTMLLAAGITLVDTKSSTSFDV